MNDGGWRGQFSRWHREQELLLQRRQKIGVFPLGETVNTVRTNHTRKHVLLPAPMLREQAFDRTDDYVLFLSKVRTLANNGTNI